MNISVNIVDGAAREMEPWEISGAGAVVRFMGMVRPMEDSKSIEGLQYEAYRPMAEKQIEKIAGELCARHGLLGMRVVHSVGWVKVGECSFVLEVAGKHRAEAIVAMGEFIDRLKRDVPIWKEAR